MIKQIFQALFCLISKLFTLSKVIFNSVLRRWILLTSGELFLILNKKAWNTCLVITLPLELWFLLIFCQKKEGLSSNSNDGADSQIVRESDSLNNSNIGQVVFRGGSRAAATSKMECFVIIVNGWKPLTIITKHSILDDAAALDPSLMFAEGLNSPKWVVVLINCLRNLQNQLKNVFETTNTTKNSN